MYVIKHIRFANSYEQKLTDRLVTNTQKNKQHKTTQRKTDLCIHRI